MLSVKPPIIISCQIYGANHRLARFFHQSAQQASKICTAWLSNSEKAPQNYDFHERVYPDACSALHDFEFRQVLNIYGPHHPVFSINNQKIINIMIFKKLQNINRQLISTNRYGRWRHNFTD